MQIKDENELKILREGGKRLTEVLHLVSLRVIPGVTTQELDKYAEELILKRGGRPSFKDYSTAGAKFAYPATLCTSINDEIVHAIPSDRALSEGDIIGLDVGMEWRGLYTDTAVTVPVGRIDKDSQKLIDVTKQALALGIAAIREDAHIGDIGYAIQSYIEKCSTSDVEHRGFSVVKELVGHGVGRAVHEEPEVPNWGRRGAGIELKEGMVLALEPMVIVGASDKIKLDKDGWTWRTANNSRSAHFEHTVVVTKNGAEVLTRSA